MNRERYAVFPLPPDKTICFVSHDTSFSLILSLSVKTEDFIHRVVVFQGFYFVLFHFGILGFCFALYECCTLWRKNEIVANSIFVRLCHVCHSKVVFTFLKVLYMYYGPVGAAQSPVLTFNQSLGAT